MKLTNCRKNSILGFIASTISCVVFAHNAHLHRLDQRIDQLQHTIHYNQSQQQQQQHALESLETHTANVALALHHTNQKIHKKNIKINILKRKSAAFKEKIHNERHALATNIKTLYMLGKHSSLELLLEESDPSKIQQTLTYYHYLNQQHNKQINVLKTTLQAAQQNLQQLNQSTTDLKQLKAREEQQLITLRSLSKKRSQLIHKIKIHIRSDAQRLQTLRQNKHRLETEIRTLNTNPLLYQAIGKPFSQLKHHLSWPTTGKLIAKFGTKIDKSQLTWKGVLFKAHLDQPVYAVADGKVIFARWLQGYGLLMIIYHGQGYITLYGRNHYLYKKAGDTVHAGDQIAAIGDTGGHEMPSLYFAIRHNTLPINPLAWFKHR